MRVAVPIRVPERVCVARVLWAPEARLAAARRRGRQSTGALALFSSWLVASWLGPAVLPSSGWSVEVSLATAAVYALWTPAALTALVVAAVGWAFDPLARQVVRARLGSAALPVLGGGLVGLMVARALSGQPVLCAWLGATSGLATLAAVVALVCRHEHVRLRALLGRA